MNDQDRPNRIVLALAALLAAAFVLGCSSVSLVNGSTTRSVSLYVTLPDRDGPMFITLAPGDTQTPLVDDNGAWSVRVLGEQDREKVLSELESVKATLKRLLSDKTTASTDVSVLTKYLDNIQARINSAVSYVPQCGGKLTDGAAGTATATYNEATSQWEVGCSTREAETTNK